MRGRKVDSEFVSEFISQCVQFQIDTLEGIVKAAQKGIAEIDAEIRHLERQKIRRSKLLDVVSAFEKPSKTHNPDDIKALSFFKIQNQHICKLICDSLKINVVDIVSITSSSKHTLSDILFCVKQLTEHKVISKSGTHLLRGEQFDEYLKFVLKEY
jgi:hypothetical protein